MYTHIKEALNVWHVLKSDEISIFMQVYVLLQRRLRYTRGTTPPRKLQTLLVSWKYYQTLAQENTTMAQTVRHRMSRKAEPNLGTSSVNCAMSRSKRDTDPMLALVGIPKPRQVLINRKIANISEFNVSCTDSSFEN